MKLKRWRLRDEWWGPVLWPVVWFEVISTLDSIIILVASVSEHASLAGPEN